MRNQHPVHLILLSAVLALILTVSGPSTAVADPGILSVQESFEKFANAWMAKLDRMGKMNIRALNITPRDQGFVGRYVCYGPECKFSIKETGSPETPFIGLLHYSEKHFLKKGETRQETIQSPGMLTDNIPVTEIFRFTHGKWVY
ncbi:MAG: hypothetical protein LWX01_11425 [Deltaproteobacteria bacterium]|nr:hypothetical protein [Deltaproteobacteria bacterium]MDL1962283.1 hypothetical protein [Deltaproteobacteria bacterium]